MEKLLKRFLKRPNWYNLRSLDPVSESFGLDRGTPIDCIYIEDFLKKNSDLIKGTTLEIADDFYSRKFGNDIEKYEYFMLQQIMIRLPSLGISQIP